MATFRTLIAGTPESPGIFERVGPVFAKEMILASRRRWNYALRVLYVVAMLVVIGYYFGYFWQFRSMAPTGKLDRIAAMSSMALYLTITVCIFQFFALQVIAPVLTGTLIGEEIRKQTLATLLLTPISSLQIVVGKLLSRTIVMVLLVATSFPLLALIRIFGGVEWHTLVALESLTLCAALFTATLSLTFSILLRKHARDPATLTYVVLVFVYLIIPLSISALLDFPNQPEDFFGWFNPFFSMILVIRDAMLPGRSPGYPHWSSPLIQCGTLLAGTLLLVAMSSVLVRRQALRQALGVLTLTPGPSASPELLDPTSQGEKFRGTPESRLLDRVSDCPVLWREWKKYFSQARWKRHLSIFLCLALLAGCYVYFWPSLQSREAHIIFVEIFFLFILARAASSPAYAITREKEADTLEVLRLTPLTPKEIVYGKTLGLLPKMVPLVALLVGHMMVFCLAGVLTVFDILQILIVLIGPLVFITGTGVYLAFRAKKIINAVSHNQILGVLLWAPCCPWHTLLFFVFPIPISPFMAAVLCLEPDFIRIRPFSSMGLATEGAFLFLTLISLLYAVLGYLFIHLSIIKFRRLTAEPNKNG